MFLHTCIGSLAGVTICPQAFSKTEEVLKLWKQGNVSSNNKKATLTKLLQEHWLLFMATEASFGRTCTLPPYLNVLRKRVKDLFSYSQRFGEVALPWFVYDVLP